jgi:2-aminoethylphosphonate dioxygenase
VKHLTILLAVDKSNMQNGGLEVVEGSHMTDIPLNPTTRCIEQDWVDAQTWKPLELEAGEMHLHLLRTFRSLAIANVNDQANS